MNKKNNVWVSQVKSTLTPIKSFLSTYSIKVRTHQYSIFKHMFKPTKRNKILDVGVSSGELLKDSNMFEKLYPHQENLTLATIENAKDLKKIYPQATVKSISPGEKLPFKNNQFDIVVSWATIEHVGGYSNQKFFLSELCRVGKKVFLTTPYRACPYEPHSGIWFIHWLPLKVFRKYCKFTGKDFWSKESNLNPLLGKDIKNILPQKKVKTIVYKMFGILPSHLVITVK